MAERGRLRPAARNAAVGSCECGWVAGGVPLIDAAPDAPLPPRPRAAYDPGGVTPLVPAVLVVPAGGDGGAAARARGGALPAGAGVKGTTATRPSSSRTVSICCPPPPPPPPPQTSPIISRAGTALARTGTAGGGGGGGGSAGVSVADCCARKEYLDALSAASSTRPPPRAGVGAGAAPAGAPPLCTRKLRLGASPYTLDAGVPAGRGTTDEVATAGGLADTTRMLAAAAVAGPAPAAAGGGRVDNIMERDTPSKRWCGDSRLAASPPPCADAGVGTTVVWWYAAVVVVPGPATAPRATAADNRGGNVGGGAAGGSDGVEAADRAPAPRGDGSGGVWPRDSGGLGGVMAREARVDGRDGDEAPVSMRRGTLGWLVWGVGLQGAWGGQCHVNTASVVGGSGAAALLWESCEL